MGWRENLNVGKLFLGNKSVQIKTYDVVITVGAEAADVINVAIQLNDPEGKALEEVGVVDWYFAADAAGLTPLTVAHDGGTAIGADGALIEVVANLSGKMISEADGDIDIDIEDAGAFTSYLVIILPCGGLVISDVITHAA